MNVISNPKLRVLLSRGPSYREANKVNWKKTYRCIKEGVFNCVKKWCDKQNADTRVLAEWKSRLLQEVRAKIKVLKKRYYRPTQKVLDDKIVKTFLNDFHSKFVITPTDKAGNNFSITCKQFYISCLLKESCITEPLKEGSTYKRVDEKSEKDIVNDHSTYMKDHNILVSSTQKQLPFLYWIPKMHKTPSKQRYIAASHSCSTKPLSKKITFCLKLIQQTLVNYCTHISKTRKINPMWIVDNSIEVLRKIKESNKNKTRNVRTYDFSTLYTSLPHKKLKERIAQVINQCFNNEGRRYIHINGQHASCKKARGKSSNVWDASTLISHVHYLIDNIYVKCGDTLFQQVIGIPMGTDCAPFLANLFLYSYEFDWMYKMLDDKKFDILAKFKYCFRYIDDLLCINNDQLMDTFMSEIYPQELSLTSDDTILATNYLDLRLEIKHDNIHTSLFDKRDAFGFEIVNFPNLSGNIPRKESYGVFVSQLIRYARCDALAGFVSRTPLGQTSYQTRFYDFQVERNVYEVC